MLDADSLKYGVARCPALCERGIGDEWNAFFAQVAQHFRLVQKCVVFNLMAGDRCADFLNGFSQHRHVEIAHAD